MRPHLGPLSWEHPHSLSFKSTPKKPTHQNILEKPRFKEKIIVNNHIRKLHPHPWWMKVLIQFSPLKSLLGFIVFPMVIAHYMAKVNLLRRFRPF
jgi:hypothetical protein